MKPDPPLNNRTNTFSFIIRSLRYRNYRLYFGGQGISLVGTWMQTVAMSWLIYRLTNSAYYLGIVAFAGQIPHLVFAPFAGVLVDRWNRHRTLIVTQTLNMLMAFVLFSLVLTGRISVRDIILISIIFGLIECFDITVRHSFVVNIIEKREDLGNAIALNTLINNLGRMLGPSIAGILVSVVGEGGCFFLNGISYIAVIAALFAMKIKPRQIKTKHAHILKELKEGFDYVFNSAPIRSIILLQALVSLMGWPATTLMPVFAKEILGGGAHTLGFLTGFSGTGALVGTLYLASRKDALSMVRLIPVAVGVFGVGLLAFSQSRNVFLSMFLLLFTGFGVFVQIAASNTVLQSIVDDRKRGRLMSIYTMSYMGTLPLGSLIAGSLANKIGAPNTVMIGAIFCIAGVVIFAVKYRLISESIHQHLHKTVSPGKPAHARSGISG